MAIWGIRTGTQGEHAERFLEAGRIYATWDRLDDDLGQVASRDDLLDLLAAVHPERSEGGRAQWATQLWGFVHDMAPGDCVLVPSNPRGVVHIGEIVGPYTFDAREAAPYRHSRQVRWIATHVAREHVQEDVLLSLRAYRTIFRVSDRTD